MKLKNQKGISMISMSVAITILIIITSILVYSSKTGNRIKALNDLYNDIELLDGKVSEYYLKYGDIPKSVEYTDWLTFMSRAELNQINPNNGAAFYVIDLNALEGVNLNYGRGYNRSSDVIAMEDVFIINEESHTIYYPRGVEVEGIVYYTEPKDWAKVELVQIPDESTLDSDNNEDGNG